MVPCLPEDRSPWGKARKEPKFRSDDPMRQSDRIVNRETGQVIIYDPFKRTWTSVAKRAAIETRAPIVLLPLSGAPEMATEDER